MEYCVKQFEDFLLTGVSAEEAAAVIIVQTSNFSQEVVESIHNVQELVESGQVESQATRAAFEQIASAENLNQTAKNV